jgi:hypothetical protein
MLCANSVKQAIIMFIVLVWAGSAAAQVVIDMPPPPPRKPEPSVVSAAPVAAARPVANRTQIDPGHLALRRYSWGRTLPFDTYWNGPSYAGIQQYSIPFPTFWWGGWGGFWPFFSGGCCFSPCM